MLLEVCYRNMVAILPSCLFLRTKPDIAKEIDIIAPEQSTKIVFDLLHGLVIRCDPGPNEAEGVRVPVN